MNLKIIIFLFILSTFLQNLHSQTNNIEKYIKIIKSKAHDTNKINAYVNLTGLMKFYPPDSVRPYFQEGLKLARKYKQELSEANLKNNFGISFAVNYLYDSSLIYFEQAKEYYLKVKDTNKILLAYSNIGNIYLKKGFYKLSIDYYLKSLEIKEKREQKLSIAQSYNDIATAYFYLGDYQSTLNYAKKAREILYHISQISYAHIINEIIFADVCGKLGNYDSALYYISLSEQNAFKLQDAYSRYYLLGDIYNNYSNFNYYKQNYPKSIEYARKGLSYYDSLQSQPSSKFYLYINLVNSYIKLKDFQNAKNYLDLAEESIQNTNLKDNLKELYLTKSAFYEAIKDFAKSLEYYKKYKIVSDSINGQEIKNNIAQMQIIFETNKKENEIKQLSLENAIKKAQISRLVLFIILISIFFLSFLLSILYFLKRRERLLILKIQEQEKQQSYEFFHSLGNQFITISLASKNNSDIDLSKNLEKIGQEMRFFSHLQYSPNFKNISLKEYLNELITEFKDYSNINIVSNYYLNDKQEKKIKYSAKYIIYRIIQELLFNAYKHSYADNITLDISKTNGNINIIYQDNGKGIDIEKLSLKSFENIKQKLALFKGNLEILSQPQNGFACNLSLKV